MDRLREKTRFFGREDALARLREWRAGSGPLCTIVGPGGIGKTRLARRFTQLALEAHEAESAAFCDLSECRSADDLIAAVAAALALPPGARDPAGQLAAALGARRGALLVLDGVEHVVDAGRDVVAGWIEAGAAARVLVTSREPLGLPGEERLDLGPLADEEALGLLADRVRAARAGEQLGADERAAALEVARRLDGIPLALELCASRAEILSLPEIRARLDQRFELLRDERGVGPTRHATLHVTIAWSWDLLTPAERRGLAQCSVFHGGFTVDAAEAVLDLGAGAPAALEVVQALRRKSLLHGGAGRGAAGRSRLGLYESIRLFAAGALEGAEREAAEARHAAYFAAEAARLDAADPPGEDRAVTRLADARDNLLAALAFCLPRDPRAAAVIALALDRLHAARGPWSARGGILDGAVRAAERTGDAALLARAHERRGAAAIARGELPEAIADLREAARLARAARAPAVESAALAGLAHVAWRRFERDEALAWAREALAVAEAAGDRARAAAALRELGDACRELGWSEEAERHLARALALHRELGARGEEAADLMRIAALLGNTRRVQRAQETLREAHALHAALGNVTAEASSLRLLSLAAYELGELLSSAELAERAIALARESGDRWEEASALNILATLLLELDREDEALASARAALALSERFGAARFEVEVLHGVACAHLVGGRDAEAEGAIDRAVALARRIADDQDEGLALGLRAALLAGRGARAEARAALLVARDRVAGSLDDAYRAALDVLEGALDDDGGAARVARLEADGALRSSLERVAARVLSARRARAAGAAAAGAPAFEIEPGGRWFRAPGATRVSLARRPSLRGILAALMQRRLAAPGEGVPWEALLAAGWPGERVQRQAAKNRVQVAVRTLRREGLEPVLFTVDEGYQLDPARTRAAR
jgi:predicted ATPase